MRKIIKYSNYFGFVLALCVMVISGCSCRAPKPTPDPLAGWKVDFDHQPDQAIVNDYQDYIRKLPSGEKNFASVTGFLKNAIDQHAVTIEIDLKGTAWMHILIYDKDDKRIKVIKYVDYHYRS